MRRVPLSAGPEAEGGESTPPKRRRRVLVAEDPKGDVVVQFSIASGRVIVAVVHESDLSDDAIGNCMAKAVKGWRFPSSGGNTVATVTFRVATSA